MLCSETSKAEQQGAKYGFGRDVPPGNLKVDPNKYQVLKQKWSIYIPIINKLIIFVKHQFQACGLHKNLLTSSYTFMAIYPLTSPSSEIQAAHTYLEKKWSAHVYQ